MRCRTFVGAQAVEAGLEPQQLAAGLLVVEGGVLQGDTDAEPDLIGLAGDIVAGHECPAPGRREQRAEDADERGLASAVRAQEAVDGPLVDREVDAPKRLGLAVAAFQRLAQDGGHGEPR